VSDADVHFPVRRVLVALDASETSLAALEAAADLAGWFAADLQALFVEDQSWWDLAGHPAARHADAASGRETPATPQALLHEARVLVERARRAFLAAVSRSGSHGEFRAVRGAPARALVEAASACDVVCVGRVGWTASARRGLGSTARAMLAARAHAVLLLRRGESVGGPTVVVYDGSESAHRGLAAALRLANVSGGPVVVLVVGPSERRAALGAQAEAEAVRAGLAVRVRQLASTTPEAVAGALKTTEAGVLVLPASSVPSDEACRAAVEAARCPVLVVR
jgi:nucleotide-binding universal stress UspA family protein